MNKRNRRKARLGLVLSGGGARGSYQAGAIQAIAEIGEDMGLCFTIITGVSAGAINAAFLAAGADRFLATSVKLVELWRHITLDEVFRTDLRSLSKIGWNWVSDIVGGGSLSLNRARSLLDASPLMALLREKIDFKAIDRNIRRGFLDAFAVSATDYTTAENVSFIESALPFVHWERARRISQPGPILLEHICASAAIPLFFSPIQIGDRYFGDGCLRNTAPLSPAIHLGADALIVIGVQHAPLSPTDPEDPQSLQMPTIARILSVLLNSVMLDGTAIDVERLKRINRTLSLIPPDQRHNSSLHIIDCLDINPSHSLSAIALQEYSRLPRTVRYLLGGLGSQDDAGNLVSYLLFDPAYCQRLTALGYKDVYHRREQIVAFLDSALFPFQI